MVLNLKSTWAFVRQFMMDSLYKNCNLEMGFFCCWNFIQQYINAQRIHLGDILQEDIAYSISQSVL